MWYQIANGHQLVPLFGANTPRLPVVVHVPWLCDLVEAGIQTFKADTAADSDLAKRVEANTAKYLVPVRFGGTTVVHPTETSQQANPTDSGQPEE